MLRSVDARGFTGEPALSLHALASSPGSKFTVGRNPESNLLLEHPAFPFLISRSHAEFVIVDGKLCIVDTGSTNGVYLDRKKLQRAVVTEVYEGELIQFGGTDKIVKDGRPEQNPFAFVVHGVAALLDAARVAAAPSPTAQETQEAGPATEAGEALPDTVAAAPSLQQQQQQQQQQPGGSTIPAVQPVQQIPPQPQQPEQVAAGDDAAQPLEQPVLPPQLSPVAALQGPVDLTGTPQNARTRAPASGRVNEIVDLTVEEDGDGDPVLSSYAAQLARMPAPAPGSSAERSRKRKEAMSSIDVPGEALDGSAEGTSSGAAGPSSRSVLSKLEDDFECVICRDMLVGAHTLVPCGHVFCGHCLMGWLPKNANCPNCRTNITAPPVPALLINNMAEGLEGRLAPEDAAERERRKKEWKQVSGAAVAGWKAMFVGGNRAAAPRRALGTDVFHRMFPMDVNDIFFQLNIPQPVPPRERGDARGRAAPRRSPRGQAAAVAPAALEAHQTRRNAAAARAAAARAVVEAARAHQPAAGIAFNPLQRNQMEARLAQLGAQPAGGAAAGAGRLAYPVEWLVQQGQEIALSRGIPNIPARDPVQPPEYGVNYHRGSRATCSGCEALIVPGNLRLQQCRRMPSGIMSFQYWHPHCYPSWNLQRASSLPGIERLLPADQAILQRMMMEARDGVVRL